MKTALRNAVDQQTRFSKVRTMKTSSRSLFVTTLILTLINIQSLYAGREAEYSDRYPKFTKIIQHGSSLYFVGGWVNRYMVVELDSIAKWHIYNCVGQAYSADAAVVLDSTDGVTFIGGNGGFLKFSFDSKKWYRATGDPSPFFWESEKGKRQDTAMSKADREILATYEFPRPSFNALVRWRSFPSSFNHLEGTIGPRIMRHRSVWFTIDFYDGEGSTGIGGLGLFDFEKKSFGVLRHKLLASCSGGLIANHGDTMIVATNHSGEYGTYGDRGLVLVDIERGLIANVPIGISPVEGEYFLAMKVVDDVLWITSDRAIMSWNFRDNSWNSYRIESLVTNKKCPVYRRPKMYSNFSNGGLPTHLDYDSTIVFSSLNAGDTVVCEWPGDKFAEIVCSNGIRGWISKSFYPQLSKMPRETRALMYPEAFLFSDSTLSVPIHTFRSPPISSPSIHSSTVEITVNGGFIQMDDADPVLTRTSWGMAPLTDWESLLNATKDVKTLAYETLEQEQREIQMKTPLVDTVITICDTMEVHRKFKGIIDAWWLPYTIGKKKERPQGISLNRHLDLWIRNGVLTYNEKPLTPGDSLTIQNGNGTYSYTILEFSTGDSGKAHLARLMIQYKVVMIP